MNSFGSALPDYPQRQKHSLVVVTVREYDFGWVFLWNTKEYVDTGNTLDAVLDNEPLIVDRGDGQLYAAGTALSLEDCVEEFRNGTRRRADQDA